MSDIDSQELPSAPSGKRQFSPKEFLKSRRPERFSDSIPVDIPSLDRSMLEYHLETLTSRSQEIQFATFARHLAEREICPNLLPQTGPTGGGDSKVDSETYPVAENIALGWYNGIGREAAEERWGFAFSAKKDWRSKVSDDVKKASGTGRGYKRVFFVTNQYVPDKKRAEVEDELTRKHAVGVRILDRTWILDKVFANEHEELAIQDLQLQTSIRKEVKKGPLDLQRAAHFDELEKRIQDELRAERPGPHIVDDCIQAADLARQMERRRTEIDGLYDRAEQVAKKFGTSFQQFQAAYQRAWTAYWWYEDYARFNELYTHAEELIEGCRSPYVLELLTNLWSLLHSAVMAGKVDETESFHGSRTALIEKELDKLAQHAEQPSTALQGRTLKLLVNLLLALRTAAGVEQILADMNDVLKECEGLVGYPFEPFAEIIAELGQVLGRFPAYEKLFDTLVSVQTERKKEYAAAQLLLKRGRQQLKADQPYGAIRNLGLALKLLYKEESRTEAVAALYLCGCAYERVGLLWAARGTMLTAASLATSELHHFEKITPSQAGCYRRLKWMELQLGRVPQTLCWHEVDLAVRAILEDKGVLESSLEAEALFDGAFGTLLLKTDPWELRWVERLPEKLERLGLFNSSAALLYVLGYEEDLKESNFPSADAHENLHSYFVSWRDNPSAQDLPSPSFCEERKLALVSHVLGSMITVESENSSPAVELGESILAALESLLSTGITDRMVAREPRINITIRLSEFAKKPFEFEFGYRAGTPQLTIECSPFDPHSMSLEMQAQYKAVLVRLLTELIAHLVMAPDLEQALERLLRDELALDRSVNFTGSFVTVGNVLGTAPKSHISDWLSPELKCFPVRRTQRWDENDPPRVTDRKLPEAGKGEPPEELRDLGRARHAEMRTESLIREALWNKAGWSATIFGYPEDGGPPFLALGFKDPGIAKQIFEGWQREIGPEDQNDLLRLTIVRGISKLEPFSYRVLIGSNPDSAILNSRVSFAAFVSRINTMNPESPSNLNAFLRSFEKHKKFYLGAAVIAAGTGQFIDAPMILKRALHVRHAWQIGRNDPDGVAIQPNDFPVVPSEEESPPVYELLEWLRKKRP